MPEISKETIAMSWDANVASLPGKSGTLHRDSSRVVREIDAASPRWGEGRSHLTQ